MEKSFIKSNAQNDMIEFRAIYPEKYPARFGGKVASGTLMFGEDTVVFGADEVEY